MNEQEIKELVLAGENATVEFKSSMRYDFQQEKTNKELAKVIAKTIAGLLNAKGGTLLIGVNDEGEILGIQKDMATLSKKNEDYYEMTLRSALGKHLGVEVSPVVHVEFVDVESKRVAVLRAKSHPEPVFFQDGDKREFYVRDGNSTRPMHIMAAHKYIARHFAANGNESLGSIAAQVVNRIQRDSGRVLGINVGSTTTVTPNARSSHTFNSDNYPPWLKVATSKVIDAFLKQLSRSDRWNRISVVSPWISEFDEGTTIRFATFLRRLVDDGTTLYVTTRPPEETWHIDAIERIAETGRANIAFVRNLHAKLYTASTSNGNFALMGSANFTRKSLVAEELGVLVNDYASGKKVVRHLQDEAFRIYRTPGRVLEHKAKFTL